MAGCRQLSALQPNVEDTVRYQAGFGFRLITDIRYMSIDRPLLIHWVAHLRCISSLK